MGASVMVYDAEIEFLIQQRQDARKAKNFAVSSGLELQVQGITLIDSPDGTDGN